MRTIIVKNQSGGWKIYAGKLMPDEQEYQLEWSEAPTWMNCSNLLDDITSGDAAISNGINYFTDVNKAIAYLQGTELTLKGSEDELLTRPKYAHSGWHMHKRFMDFTTATKDSLVNIKWDGSDFGDATLRFFNTDLTIEYTGDQNELNANCVVTAVDWEISHDFEALGGKLLLKIVTPQPMRVFTVIAPDIPEVMGGCVPFASNINTEFCKECTLDGRTPKYVAYDTIYHSGKFRYVFRHNLEDNYRVMFGMELFEE